MIKILKIFLLLFININFLYSQTFINNTSLNIPDNNSEVCSSINVTDIGIINNVYELQSVCIDITHTYDADLDIYLQAPDGTRIELSTDNGGGSNNYENTCFTINAMDNITSGSAPFNGTFLSEGNLNDVNNGQNANGVWQLCVVDDFSGDVGILNNWSLSFGTGCKWSMVLIDTYGDGWNGNGHIEIIVNGVNFGDAYVYSDDGKRNSDSIRFDLDVNDGDNVQINFISGSWDNEDEYYIYDQDNNLIHSEGTGGSVPGNYSFTVNTCSKPQYTTSDCEGAIKVCDGYYSYTNSAYGDGKYEEIAGRASCYGETILYGETAAPKGEINSTWYVFDVQNSGNLEFSVVQNNSDDDYDWVLYDLTNKNCDDIVNGNISSLSCNWDISSDSTGMSSSTTGSGWESQVYVNAGEKYALVIDNWSMGGSGYDLYLNRGSALIYDNIPPEIDQITKNHVDTIWFDFTESVECSSVSTSDFSLSGPSAPYTINSVNSEECNNGANMSEHWYIIVSPNLEENGNYTLTLVGDVNDKCSNPTNHNNGTFLPVQLIDFNGKYLNNDQILLKWTTISEINNDFFNILRSYDGYHFEKIGKVNGNGNSNSEINYLFIDSTFIKNKIYYKLQQVDYNKKTTYSNIIFLYNIDFISDYKYNIYPNPSNGFININTKYNNIEILNMLGEKVKYDKFENGIYIKKAGVYLIIIDYHYKYKIIIK